ncbi:hypothetical protein MMC14_003977 [Varicellaria rhodocarpa]|nr:hypothetical protein [Varicellaria rhodocarpa]
MASSSGVPFCQSTQALEELLLRNDLLPTSDAISHCEQTVELVCRIILGNNYHEVLGSNPSVYTSTVDGIVLVLAPSGSYALGAWDQSAVIPCAVAGTPSGNTFFDLARQKIQRAKDLGVVLLKAENRKDDVVFEIDVKGVRFCFQYF